MVVSHDRWFLDRVATHILAFEEDGTAHWIFGNYSEYRDDLRRRKGSAADQPHRMKYRTLKRCPAEAPPGRRGHFHFARRSASRLLSTP